MIHFDIDNRYQDEQIVGSAISRREGVMFSVVSHVLFVLAIILVIWYVAAIALNSAQVIERTLSAQPGWTLVDLARLTLSMDRPVLPAPHQIVLDLVDSIFGWPIDSLIFCASVRAVRSAPPPGGKGTTSLIGRFGYGAVCADAPVMPMSVASMVTTNANVWKYGGRVGMPQR